jgi:hypothetical protein
MTALLRATRIPLLVLAGLPSVLVAQSTTTAALSGAVRDGSGNPVAGATVRLASPALIGGTRMLTTSSNGSFHAPALPPGAYAITVEAKGFATLRATENLVLGQTATSAFRLQPEAGATVEVTASSAAVEAVSLGPNSNLDAEVIANVPVGRDLTQVAALTPGVTVSDTTSGAAVRAWGSDTFGNAYTIDGLNVGDAKSGEKWVYANPDWFSQVQVGGLGAGAEFGGFSGAAINGVVKSGGNAFEGSLSAYYQKNSWAAKRDNDRLLPSERTLYDGHYSDVTASVGGPILKDRLWYFVSAEAIKDSATDSPVGVAFPVKLDNPRYLAKLTWQALPTATWDAFLEYDEVNRENKYADRRYTHEAAQKQMSPSRLFTTSWTQTLGQSAVMTLRYSALNARDDRASYNPGGYSVEISGSAGLTAGANTPLGPTEVAFPELIGKNYWGNVARSNLLRQNFRGRNTFAGTFDFFKSGLFSSGDSHALRMGFEWEQSTNQEKRWIASPNGIAYRVRVRSGGLRPYRAITGAGRDVSTRMDRQMLSVQDTWTVNSRLQIRPGLRWEQFEGRPFGGSALWKTSTLAPRLGFTYNVTQDQSQVAKLHLGRYYTALSSDYFQRAIPGAYSNTNVFFWGSSSQLVNPYNPAAIPVNTTVGGPDYAYAYNFNVSTLDPGHKQPYTDEVLFGYDVRVGRHWTLGLTAVYRAKKDILVQNDPSWANPAYTVDTFDVTSPLTGQTYRTYISDIDLGDPNNGHKFLLTNEPKAKNTYRMLTLAADRALAGGWSFNAALTWAKAEGNYSDSAAQSLDNFNDPNAQINSYGRLPYVNDREARVRATYEFPWAWKTRLSASFTYLSGERYTPVIDLSNVFELNQNALTINAAPRGSASYPSRRLLDLRLSQELNFRKKVRTELFLDIFNVLNDGKAYAWDTAVADDLGTLGTYQRPFSVDDPRRLRIGARIRF